MRRIITEINLLLCFGLITLLTPPLVAASTGKVPTTASPPDPRFGAIETYDAPGAAADMGAGWTRIPFLWAQMQPSGTHEWFPPISDEALALELAQGRQPVGLVITTPGWATDMSIGPGVPYGLHTGHNDPNNLWANFLRSLVTTYAGRIDRWIIWNEPDVWDAAHPGYTWGGSVEDFLQLQRVAYLAIKEANPNATVIFSGTSYWWDAAYGRDLFFRRYLDALVQDLGAPGNNYYCDAVALHIYFQPDFVYSITALYHQLMREHGFDKPVWIVETNAAPSLDPQMPAPNARFAITLDEQAAYIIQAFAMGIAGGATRIGVFKMIDTPTDLTANPEPFGLVRADGSRRPAFAAYRVAATYLAGFQSGQLEQRPEVSIVTIPRASGTTTALWTRTPAPATVEIPARTGSATLVDMWGNRRAISSSGGVYLIQLPGASCTHGSPCIIGGPPFLIVEGSVDAAPPPPAQPAASTGESTGDDGNAQKPDDAQETVPVTATPTPPPKYTVSLRPVEIKGARDVWHKRALPGYQIELVAGPPFHLYALTVVNGVLAAARRSLEPLAVDLNDLDTLQGSPSLTPTMTTLYVRRNASPYTIEGLFDRVQRYYEAPPTSPECDTQVTVLLNGDWAFPRRIVEQWADDCQTEEEPSWVAVVAFATLTPTPTRPGPTPSRPASSTPSPPPTGTASPTVKATTAASPTTPASPTPVPAPATSHNNPLWVAVLAGAVIVVTLLIRRNGQPRDTGRDRSVGA
jgi:hypothetical protein